LPKTFKHTLESKEKISKTLKNKINAGFSHNGLFKKGHTSWNAGISCSEETKDKISKSTKNAMKSKDLIKKIIDANLGRKQTEETKMKRAVSLKKWWKINKNSEACIIRAKKISFGVKASFKKNPYLREISKQNLKKSLNKKDFRMKALLKSLSMKGPNKPEQKVLNVLKNKSSNFRYTGDGSFWISSKGKNFNPDFTDNKNKKIIEVFGIYWHKLIYPREPHREELDKLRIQAYKSRSYEVLIVWDIDKDIKKKVLEFV